MPTAEEIVEVLIQFKTEGAAAVRATANNIIYSMQGLSRVNESLVQSTGKLIPATAQQVNVLRLLAQHGDTAAASMVKLAQGSNIFYQVFSGNVKQNLAALFKNQTAVRQTTGALSRELNDVQVVSNATTGSLSRLADIPTAKFRIMGSVWAEEEARIVRNMEVIGKQAQWLGRQMIVGVTAPITILGGLAVAQALQLGRAETEIKKYGVSLASIRPTIEQLTKTLGVNAAELSTTASLWAAAGFDDPAILSGVTRLTAELQTLTQGDLDLNGAMEVIRTTMNTFEALDPLTGGLRSQAEQLQATTKDMYALQAIQSKTSVTMTELAQSIPLVAATAKRLNLSIAETAALFAGMRQQGIAANEAANALKFGLLRMVNPTKQAQEAFEKLTHKSLQSFLFTKEGASKGIEGLKAFAAEFKNLTQQQQLSLAGKIFQNRQASRLLNAIDALNRANSDTAKALKIANNEEAAATYWHKQLQIVVESDAKKWDIFKAKVALAAAKLGRELLPSLQGAANQVLKLLDAFEHLGPGTQKAILGIAGVVAAIGPATYAMGQFHLILARIRQFLIVTPLRTLFGVESMENTVGMLQKIGAETKNNTLKVLAGFPTLHKASALSATEQATAEDLLVGALARETGAVSSLSIAYGRLALAKQGLLAMPGLGVLPDEALLKLQTGEMQFEDLVNQGILKKQLTPTGGEFFRLGAKTTGGGGGVIKSETVAELRSAYSAVGQTVGTTAGVALGENLSKAAALTASQEAPAVVAPIETGLIGALKRKFNTFTSFFKTLTFQSVVPGQGPFALIETTLSNTLGKLILFSALLAVVARHWREIWAGMKSGVEAAKQAVLPAIQSVVNGFNKLTESFSKGHTGTVSFWQALGKIIGGILANVAKLAVALNAGLGVIIITVIQAAIQVFERFVGILTGLVQILTLQIPQGISSLSEAFGGMGQKVGLVVQILSKVGAVLLAIFVATKIIREIQAIITAFKALTTAVTLGTLLMGNSFEVLRASIPKIIEGIAIIVSLAISWYTATKNVNRGMEELKNHTDDLTKSFSNLSQEISSKGSLDDFKSKSIAALDAIQSAVGDVAKAFGPTVGIQQLTTAITEIDNSITSATRHGSQLVSLSASTKTLLGFEHDKVVTTAEAYQKMQGLIERRNNLQEINNSLVAENASFTNILKNASKEQTQFIEQQIEGRKSNLEIQLRIDSALKDNRSLNDDIRKKYSDEYQTNKFIYEILTSIGDEISRISELNSTFNTLSGDFLAMMRKIPGAVKSVGQQIPDELLGPLKNQLSSMANRVTGAIMDAFNQAAQARTDALDAFAQAQMDAFDKSEKAQLDAIDKQIKGLQDLDKVDEWKLKQDEYRAQREQLLQDQALNSAINFREQMKAIQEGRTDDARLLALQNIAQASESQDKIDELDKNHNNDIKQHQRDAEIDKLQAQKDALQTQLDAQKEALQKQLEAQKKALQDSIENERTQLQNQLSLLTEFGADSEQSWNNMWKNLKDAAQKSGVDITQILADFANDWGFSLTNAFKIAYDRAQTELATQSQQAGDTAAEGIFLGFTGNKEIDKVIAFYNNLQAALADLIAAQKSGTAGENLYSHYQSAVGQFMNAYKNLTKKHSGGPIEGRRGQDVPINAQAGEYMIRGPVVNELGQSFFDKLNYKGREALDSYHSGGLIDVTGYGSGAKGLGLGLGAGANIGLSAGGGVSSGTQLGMTAGFGKELVDTLVDLSTPTVAPGGVSGVRNSAGATLASIFGAQEVEQFFPHKFNYFNGIGHSFIGSTGIYSQHAYGNAIDFFGGVSDMADLFTWAAQNHHLIHLAHAIHSMKAWSWNYQSIHPYDMPPGGSPHYDHVHLDWLPQYAGAPPGYPYGPTNAHLGGITNGPTFKRIGEAGKEALIPLDSTRGITALSMAVKMALGFGGFSSPQFGLPQISSSFSDLTEAIKDLAQKKSESSGIIININGNFIGDDTAYKKLAIVLNEANRKINRNQNGVSKIVINRSG